MKGVSPFKGGVKYKKKKLMLFCYAIVWPGKGVLTRYQNLKSKECSYNGKNLWATSNERTYTNTPAKVIKKCCK